MEKTSGSAGTIYWYAAVGVVAESDLTGALQHEYIFFAGQRVARKDLPGNSVFYYFSDHLQRTSVVTDASGTIKAESDYYPFGGELQIVNNDTNDYKFAGKKRDSETQLDYFGARYYSSGFGRFVTADWSSGPATVPYAHLDNPQTLNLYSYVDNNPASGFDADGHAREYMVYNAGSWGPNMIIGGPIIETDVSAVLDTTTNVVTVISVQTSLFTGTMTEALNSLTSQTSLPGGGAVPGEQNHGEPARLVQYGQDATIAHDNKPGPLPGTCESCYGAQTLVHYFIADEAGHPLLGQFTITEHIVKFEGPKNANKEISFNQSTNGLVVDKIGVHSDKPIRSVHAKTEQTFSVGYNGKTYWLSTRVNQMIDKSPNSGWTIKAVVAVP